MRIGIGQSGKENSYVGFASLGSTLQRPKRTGLLILMIASHARMQVSGTCAHHTDPLGGR